MNPHCSSAELRAWIGQHLDPLEVNPGEAAVSRKPGLPIWDPAHAPKDSTTLVPAAVLIALVERPGGLSVILTRRSDALRRHSGQIALPGRGRCDPGEDAVGRGPARGR